MNTLLSIIILNYKTPQVTLDCIKSIQNIYENELTKKSFEIILVDNHSEDNSIEVFENFIKKDGNGVRLFSNKSNNGFGGGCNYGAKFAKGTLLLFLNSDTLVLNRGLSGMTELFNTDKHLGVLGGKLMNEDKTVQLTVGRFHDLINVFTNLVGMEYRLLLYSPKKVEDVEWVTGGCLMIKHDIFKKLRGFDENIFMYMEDVELCYRVHKAKYKIMFFPFINIIHKKGVSSNHTFNIVHTYKGYLYFFKKHRSNLEYMVMKKLFYYKAKIYYIFGKKTNNEFLKNTYKEVYSIMS